MAGNLFGQVLHTLYCLDVFFGGVGSGSGSAMTASVQNTTLAYGNTKLNPGATQHN